MGDIIASFLLPTRGRVDRLKLSLGSLLETAKDGRSFEALVRADDDDAGTLRFLKDELHDHPEISLASVGPRGRGYLDLHLMVNELARQARGDFLVLWNDDALMLTQGWDDVLRGHLVDPPRVYMPTSPGHTRNIFPIVRRSVHEAMGRFSESALNDFYMSTVARRAGIELPIAISVKHDHPFQGGTVIDQTYLDAVQACGVCKHDDKDQRIMACLAEDVARVKELITR